MNRLNGTGPFTGINTFLILAAVAPGFIYYCVCLILFWNPVCNNFVLPYLEVSVESAIGYTLFLGLTLTAICFSIEIYIYRPLTSLFKKGDEKYDYNCLSVLICKNLSGGKINWYFFQVWGQSIMHFNIAIGIAIIFISKAVIFGLLLSPRDIYIILASISNFLIFIQFDKWYSKMIKNIFKG